MRSKQSGVSAIGSSDVSLVSRAMNVLLRWADRFGRQTSLARTVGEVTFAASLWAMLWSFFVSPVAGSSVAFMTVIASCVFLGAFRMSRSQPSIAGFGREVVAMTLIIAPTATVQLLIALSVETPQIRTEYVPFAVLLADVAVFVVGRFVVVALPWWYHFHQQKLRWQLVNAHVLVVLLVLSVPVAIGLFALIRSTSDLVFIPTENPVENIVLRIAFRVIPVLALLVVILGLTLIVVVPPSIALSYAVARQMTRRLEHLAAATTAIREGDHSARVAVRGHDEVAKLQTNFNAMANVLEAAIAEAAGERDNTLLLLDQRRALVASVSHELRTPLTIIRGYLDSTLASRERLEPALEHDLTVMHAEAVRLQRLIDDLFALSRAEIGTLTLHTQETEIGRILRRCVNAMSAAAWRAHRVEILVEAPEDLPTLDLDADRLEQIIFNLLDNAVRHSSPGGLVHVEAIVDGDHVRIEVADTGEGIPPAEIDSIWERFYRGSNAKDARGSGIGLAIVRELTESMGGDASVISTPDDGTRFRLRFPFEQDLPDLPISSSTHPVLPATTP